MQKIAVIGSPGAGKSTFAKQLSQILSIEVIHLDTVFWQPDWNEVPQNEWKNTLRELISREYWIMDGNHPEAIDQYLEAADTIIFLDMHQAVCVWRVLARLMRNLGRSRPDLPGFAPEVLDWDVLKGVWFYPKAERPLILQKLDHYAAGRQVYQLRKLVEAKKFLQQTSFNAAI